VERPGGTCLRGSNFEKLKSSLQQAFATFVISFRNYG
jgi:hypothetical protein